jgi:hypothetical protein
VRGVLAHAPALVFVTGAYYLTDLCDRGAWVEFMAFSALPLPFAASLRRWRARRVRRLLPERLCAIAASHRRG